MFEFFDQVLNFFTEIKDFIGSGIYTFATETFAELIVYLTIAGIKFKIYTITFAWDIAKQILEQLNFTSFIETAFDGLNANIKLFINFFGIPNCINIISSAYVTRYVLTILGF